MSACIKAANKSKVVYDFKTIKTDSRPNHLLETCKKDKHVDGVSLEAFELFGRFGVPPFPSSLSIY